MQKQKLHLKQQQKLLPQQIQLMQMFRLSTDEFEAYVSRELEENTALEKEKKNEENEDPSDFLNTQNINYATNYYKHSKEKKEIPLETNMGFHQYLLNQMQTFSLSEKEFVITEFLIGSIDEQGYLRRNVLDMIDDLTFKQNIFIDKKVIENIISKVIHQLEPVGVGARNLQECLKIQLQNKKQTKIITRTLKIINDFFTEFAKKNFKKIMEKLHISEVILKECQQEILKLNPKPTANFKENYKTTEFITPDFDLQIIDEKLDLTLNAKNSPVLYVSKEYTNLLETYKNSNNKEQKKAVNFVQKKIENAKWFANAVKERETTLLKTMGEIIKYQKKYFLTGDEMKLKALKLKDVSDEINMDISTVSRIANNKYVATPYGTKLLKFFFSKEIKNKKGETISTKEIKISLKNIIDNENKKHPFNDKELVLLLEKKGYKIARRTINKYREHLNIPVARLRKKI